MRTSYFLYLFILFLLACASHPSRENFIEIPMAYRSYTDSISVSNSLTLAETSYTLGCVEAHKKLGKVKGSNLYCQKEAKRNVKQNILYILDHPGQ